MQTQRKVIRGVRRSSSSPRVCSTCAPLGSNWNDRHKHVRLTEERWRVWEALQHTSHLSHSPSNHQQMQGVRARNTKVVDQLHGTTYIQRLLLGNNKGKMHAGTVRGVEGSLQAGIVHCTHVWMQSADVTEFQTTSAFSFVIALLCHACESTDFGQRGDGGTGRNQPPPLCACHAAQPLSSASHSCPLQTPDTQNFYWTQNCC